MDWTPELKEQVIKQYLESNPTAENGTEICQAIAEGLDDATVNGVRIILAKATDADGNKIYISKASGSATKDKDAKPASKRVNKADAVAALVEVIEEAELNVDDDIISKLTGKAAVYFTELLTAIKG